MKKIQFFLIAALLVFHGNISAQEPVDSIKFFTDKDAITMTLETDLKDLLGKKQKDRYIPATVTMIFPGVDSIKEDIKLSVRGNFRRENCYMPGLRLDFHNPTSPRLYKLDKLKLSCGCSQGSENEQLVLREFLAYKIYNELTDMSFRVRLAKVTFSDSKGKKKPYTQYGFFIEDVDNMAHRLGMKQKETAIASQELSDRQQMTLVALYEYLLGNTDWSVPNLHNVKLIVPKKDTTGRPYAVPYDFDISGFVDPPYATIDERFNIETVRDRLYRGFPRTMEELQTVIKLFNDKKSAIYNLVNSFTPLDNRSKNWLNKFMDDFYKTINNTSDVKRYFIDEARTN